MEVSRITAVVTANTADFMRGMAQVDAATKRTAAQMNGMTTAVSRASTRMTSIGSVLTKRMSLPLLAIGGASVAMAASFETSMAKIQGLVGVAANDVEKLAGDARRIGPAYGKSANEAAEALFYITSAGIDASEAASVLEASAKASAVGLGDTATVADLATSAMNAYGSSVLPAASATDVMVKAVKLGKLQSEELAGSMGRVLPVASAMGVSFDQVGAAFAALSRTGTNAAEAATQIRGILASILRPTKMAQETLAEYGMSAGDLRKQIREKGLLSVLQTLTTTFGDNEEAQARVFGNIRALSGVMDLMGKNTKTTQKIFDEMSDSTGALDDAFAVTEQTSAFKMAKAMESLKTALSGVGSAIAPVIGSIAEGLSKIGSALSALPGPVKQFTAALIGIGAVAGPLLLIMGKLGGAFGKVGAAAGAGGAAGKVGLLARALPLMTNPLGLATVAVGAGITALFAFRNELSHGERAIRAMSERQQAFKDAVAGVGAAFTASGQSVRAASAARAKYSEATDKAYEATRKYFAALAAGQRANETEAQFLARIAGLRRNAAAADANRSQAAATSNAAIRNSVDALTKLEKAGQNELTTARQRADESKRAIQAHALMGKSEAERTKLLNEAELAQADLGVVEARRVSNLKTLASNYQSTIKQVKQSNLADDEKRATLDRLNRGLSTTRTEIKNLQGGGGKATVKVKADTAAAKSAVDTIKAALQNIDGRVFRTTLKFIKETVGLNSGGIVPGFASGGTVRGPGGVDRVPAMLTAGEAVLTKKQQELVNSGMTIPQAFRATGAARFAKGGYAAGFRKRKKGETAEQYKKARAEYVKQKRQEARDRLRGAGGDLASTVGQQLTSMLSAKYGGGFTGPGGTGFTIGKIEELRRAQEANLKALEGSFTSTVELFGQAWSGGFKDLEKAEKNAFKQFEKDAKATIDGINDKYEGLVKAQQKAFEASTKAINEQFDALTASEQALKNLNDQAQATDLAAGIADAQAALEDARAFGSAAQIKAAQKALNDALLAQQRADLEKQAETERTAAEDQRESALTALQDANEEKLEELRDAQEEELTLAQETIDKEREAKAAGYEAARAALQSALDTRLQQQRDADAAQMALLELQREQEQAVLDDRIAGMTQHFENANELGRAQTSRMVKTIRNFSKNFRYSGNILLDELIKGIEAKKGPLAKAAKSVADILRQYLQLNSPADKGPLSDLDHWFDALAPTLASGIDTSAIDRELGSLSGGSMRRGGGGSSVTINLNVSDQTFSGMSRDQADRVARDIKAALDRQVRFTV